MIKPFNIVRDLENKKFTTGSDTIVLTQFDNGIYIDFEILMSGKVVNWNNGRYTVKVTFKNGEKVVVERKDCKLQADGKWRYEITTDLTGTSGRNVRGILDVEQGGVRVASSQFEIMILEHLATKQKQGSKEKPKKCRIIG